MWCRVTGVLPPLCCQPMALLCWVAATSQQQRGGRAVIWPGIATAVLPFCHWLTNATMWSGGTGRCQKGRVIVPHCLQPLPPGKWSESTQHGHPFLQQQWQPPGPEISDYGAGKAGEPVADNIPWRAQALLWPFEVCRNREKLKQIPFQCDLDFTLISYWWERVVTEVASCCFTLCSLSSWKEERNSGWN